MKLPKRRDTVLKNLYGMAAAYGIMKRACIRFFNGDTDTLTF